jgi:hypothetical protein
MLRIIKHPITALRVIRVIAKEITPEQRDEFDSAKTKERKAKIATQIVGDIFPEIAYISTKEGA